MAGTGAVRVLLVDELAMFVEGVAAALRNDSDIDIVGTATAIPDAVAEVEDAGPDVVVLPYFLPGGDGLELAATLKELGAPCRYVMLTYAQDADLIPRVVEAGFHAFVDKRADLNSLRAAIRAAARGDCYLPTDVLFGLVRASEEARPLLSVREIEVLQLVADGHSTDEITQMLFLSRHTVRNHVRNILGKLGVHTKLEAVLVAASAKLIELPAGRSRAS
jgi:DNA-binding NarL/FixJ family response regulator